MVAQITGFVRDSDPMNPVLILEYDEENTVTISRAWREQYRVDFGGYYVEIDGEAVYFPQRVFDLLATPAG